MITVAPEGMLVMETAPMGFVVVIVTGMTMTRTGWSVGVVVGTIMSIAAAGRVTNSSAKIRHRAQKRILYQIFHPPGTILTLFFNCGRSV
jgi:MFS superfamily sulfate permease-like transporter